MALRKTVVPLALLVLLAIPGPAVADAARGPGIADLESVAARLAAPATQEAAIRALQEISDPSVETLLRELKDGTLYRWKGRIAILGDDGALKDLAGRPILDNRGQPVSPAEGQEAIALEERLFGLVQNVLERLEVFSADGAARKSAAFKLGNSRDVSAIPVLTKAAEREADTQVKAVVEEALNRLRLSSSEASVRASAAQFLGQAWSESSLAQLQVMAEQDPDAAVKLAAQAAVRRIELFLIWRNLAGYLFNGLSLGAVLLIMSLGLAVTFGLMGIINMAHGEMLMLGSYTAYVV